jgi:hypothetical protein
MKMIKFLMLVLVSTMLLPSCTENYSNGERIGMITKFSQKGLVYSSWEGSLNTTQTGMNSATPFEFSVDNDVNDPKVISTLDSAATQGWKVKIKYHETWNKNWLKNRGETNYFVKEVEVLDRDPMGSVFGGNSNKNTGGRVVDTVYVVIVPKEKIIQ